MGRRAEEEARMPLSQVCNSFPNLSLDIKTFNDTEQIQVTDVVKDSRRDGHTVARGGSHALEARPRGNGKPGWSFHVLSSSSAVEAPPKVTEEVLQVCKQLPSVGGLTAGLPAHASPFLRLYDTQRRSFI